MTTFNVNFNPGGLRTSEQQNITLQVTRARARYPELKDSYLAEVYSDRQEVWWHANPDDTRLHVTVLYKGAKGIKGRVHVYEDGSTNIKSEAEAPAPKNEEEV
ncbi:hypothetical protein C8Q77DRAFT_1099308 [Trametes polyzona]|nr:hypothetical protein C8Q77DRAFT_1099308 [Trametes polyzona]